MISLVVFVLLCVATASLGALFPPGSWYAALAKPAWTPPSWLFGPVWSVLYLMIAVSGWLIWRAAAGFSLPITLWASQLLLNALWSPLFFGLHRPALALVDIVLLWALIVGTIVAAWPVQRLATALLMPYAVWVAYAAALNAALWRLNP